MFVCVCVSAQNFSEKSVFRYFLFSLEHSVVAVVLLLVLSFIERERRR